MAATPLSTRTSTTHTWRSAKRSREAAMASLSKSMGVWPCVARNPLLLRLWLDLRKKLQRRHLGGSITLSWRVSAAPEEQFPRSERVCKTGVVIKCEIHSIYIYTYVYMHICLHIVCTFASVMHMCIHACIYYIYISIYIYIRIYAYTYKVAVMGLGG